MKTSTEGFPRILAQQIGGKEWPAEVKVKSISSQLFSTMTCKTLLSHGVLKIYKPDIFLQPIASLIHSPTYQL